MEYLIVIEGKEGSYSAYAPDISGANGVGKSLEVVKKSLSESISLHADAKYPKPKILTREDAEKHAFETFGMRLEANDQIDFIRPANINPVSLEIASARESLGLSQAELGRRLSMPRSNVNRLENPFYFGHSLAILNRVAEALGVELEVSFGKAA